jgi:hypothetical protein
MIELGRMFRRPQPKDTGDLPWGVSRTAVRHALTSDGPEPFDPELLMPFSPDEQPATVVVA